MNIKMYAIGEYKVVHVSSDEQLLNTVSQSLDVLLSWDYEYSPAYIIIDGNLINPDFFELSTKFAGELLEKCHNYQINLAVIEDINKYDSKSLTAFTIELNRGNKTMICDNLDSCLIKLQGQLA